jgi:hypothetical protein
MLQNTLVQRPRSQSRNGNGSRPPERRRQSRAPTAPTPGEQLRAGIAGQDLDPAALANANRVASQLDRTQPPKGTVLRIAPKGVPKLTLFWENPSTQHCIQLDIDLQRMLADYEYSMVCHDQDQLKPFPERPLGSSICECIDLDLDRQASWTWLNARIRATGRHLPPQERP